MLLLWILIVNKFGLETFQERAHSYYDGMTKDQFAMMQKFIQGRSSKTPSKL